MSLRLIIDTDPGVDDMVAILAALAAEQLEVAGISTVGGNVPLYQVTANALRILAAAGRGDIPVYAGSAGIERHARAVHGGDGLGNCSWPEAPFEAQRGEALDFLEAVLAGGDTALACLGPLTNLAELLRRRPELARAIPQVALMGGGFGQYSFESENGMVDSNGNVTPDAEFNIHSDISAARTVFESGVPVVMIPLDVSLRTLVSMERLETLSAISPRCAVVAGCIDRYNAFSRNLWGYPMGPLHDPNVIAYLAKPELYGLRRGMVTVLDSGQTVLEPAVEGPHRIAMAVDANGFFDWTWSRLRELLP